MMTCSTSYKQSKGRAHIEPDTLKVIKFPFTHNFTRDPDWKFELKLQMESEMKILAETTTDSPRSVKVIHLWHQ